MFYYAKTLLIFQMTQLQIAELNYSSKIGWTEATQRFPFLCQCVQIIEQENLLQI